MTTYATNKIKQAEQLASEAGNRLSNLYSKIVNPIKDFTGRTLSNAMHLADLAGKGLSSMFSSIMAPLKNIANQAQSMVSGAGKSIADSFSKLTGKGSVLGSILDFGKDVAGAFGAAGKKELEAGKHFSDPNAVANKLKQDAAQAANQHAPGHNPQEHIATAQMQKADQHHKEMQASLHNIASVMESVKSAIHASNDTQKKILQEHRS